MERQNKVSIIIFNLRHKFLRIFKRKRELIGLPRMIVDHEIELWRKKGRRQGSCDSFTWVISYKRGSFASFKLKRGCRHPTTSTFGFIQIFEPPCHSDSLQNHSNARCFSIFLASIPFSYPSPSFKFAACMSTYMCFEH